MDTGLETITGGRVKRLEPMLSGGTFMLTYGDGVADVDLRELLAFHRRHGRHCHGHGRAAAGPVRRTGVRRRSASCEFTEKPQIGEGWINGGFMVLEPAIFDYLDGDATSLEIARARTPGVGASAGRVPS